MSDQPLCGAPSYGILDGVEQWYECHLPEGHSHEVSIVDDQGNPLTVTVPSDHVYEAVDTKPAKAY
jgi:hypothetical protein